MRRELQRLNEHLRENLRLQQVHSQVRRLGLIENPSDGVRPQRQHHLLWRVPEILSRRECGVHRVVVAAQPLVERLIDGMRRRGESAADHREIEILFRRQMLHVFDEISKEGPDAGARRRRRLFGFSLLVRRLLIRRLLVVRFLLVVAVLIGFDDREALRCREDGGRVGRNSRAERGGNDEWQQHTNGGPRKMPPTATAPPGRPRQFPGDSTNRPWLPPVGIVDVGDRSRLTAASALDLHADSQLMGLGHERVGLGQFHSARA